MNWLRALCANPFLLSGLASWFIAQVLKLLIHLAVYKKLEIERIYGDGGMPSGHSATVASLATMCGLSYGLQSVEFAMSTILAIVVCHDATGVRWETGQQAAVLNELLRYFEPGHHTNLKELVGHTPLQVAAGVLIGITNALIMYYFVF